VTHPDPPPSPTDNATADSGDAFLDPSSLAELEALAASHGSPGGPLAISTELDRKLDAFLVDAEAGRDALGARRLTEEAFVSLPLPFVAERVETLLDVCRQAGQSETVRAVESFIVFFQALLPTLGEEGSREVRRFFFRLAPTLIHIGYNDFSEDAERRREGRLALQSLENVLIEVSSVRLTPSETDLAFRSIDHMAAFIGAGDYAMATEVISTQLLEIIVRNKLMRSLFRIMEVEVNIQRYLKENLGYSTPQIRIPDDFARLAEYGPLRVLKESDLDGAVRCLIQVQIPHIPILRDIVLHLAAADASRSYDLRLDALGSVEVDVPPGVYSLGLVYQPQ
jgi:hypothetical protein